MTISQTKPVREEVEPQLLGHLLGLKIVSKAEMHARVLSGFSYAALQRFQRKTGLPKALIDELIALPSATASRRKQEGKLSVRESDRLARLARLVEQASELFEGDLSRTTAWLQRPQRGLGDKKPISFLATDAGTQEVEDLIERLLEGSVA